MKKIIAYLYDGNNYHEFSKEIIEKIDYINYSFGLIKDGIVYIKENSHVQEVLKYKEYGVKVVLSIGGWGADGFSEAVSKKETREVFIKSIIDLIKKYDFDGVDLDWEYPTVSFANIKASPNDTENFTELCYELRKKLDNFNKKMILSIASPCSDRYYDYEKLNSVLDFVNIMSYDLSVSSKNAVHHCNLYENNDLKIYASADKAVREISKYIDISKIVIGIAFYGRLGEFNELNKKLGDCLKEPQGKGYPYSKIKELLLSGKEELWDEKANASYIIDNYQFISYDSKRSIKSKTEYVKKNDLGGVMFWELGAKDTKDLLETIYFTLKD